MGIRGCEVKNENSKGNNKMGMKNDNTWKRIRRLESVWERGDRRKR